jgi:hypothetical protein
MHRQRRSTPQGKIGDETPPRRRARARGLVRTLLATLIWANGHTKIFTEPDGAFSFQYSNQLIRCEKSPRGEWIWNPPQNCSAYIPTCDELIGTQQRQTSIACFAYPRNRFTNTPAFEAATFSVEIVDHNATRKSCLTEHAEADEERVGTNTINGISFTVFEIRTGAMNQFFDGRAYRTFHKAKCYQLGINVATANATVYEPPVRTLTDADWHEVNGTLEEALKSFRFLK